MNMAKHKSKKPKLNKKRAKEIRRKKALEQKAKLRVEKSTPPLQAKKEKPEPKVQKKPVYLKKYKPLALATAACLALILLGIGLAKIGFFAAVQGAFVPRGKISTGSLPISEGYNEVKNVPKGQVRYRINKSVVFENRYGQGDIMLENPETCEFNLVFSFYTKNDSKLIYTSPMLKPGEYIFKDKLQKRLKQGDYECTYKVIAYTADKVRVGETGGFLTISIES